MTPEITEEQRKVVLELKTRTINDVTPKMLQDELLFYRFCKARDFNLTEAEDMLRKHILWRKENQMDTILSHYEPPEVLEKYVPAGFMCFDKEGCPVRYTDWGQMDMKGLWNSVKPTDAFPYFMQLYEKEEEIMYQQTKKLGKPVTKGFFIHNFGNFKLSNATHRKSIQFSMHIFKNYIDNFPEKHKGAVVINASIYFTWLYSLLKPILPASIIQSTSVYASDGWKEVLCNVIDPNELPTFLGGNKTDPDGNPLCKNFVKHGERIPERYYLCNGAKKFSSRSDAEKITVRPFSKEEVSLQVKQAGSILNWEFETKNRDIEFSVHFRDESLEVTRSMELIPKQRIDTSYEPEIGLFKCDKPGIYTITFDNTYSWMHPKEIYYKIKICGPDGKESV